MKTNIVFSLLAAKNNSHITREITYLARKGGGQKKKVDNKSGDP